MHGEWWEKPTCWLCDYWWVLLILLALCLTGYFSREQWLPHVLPPTTTPTVTSPPTLTSTLTSTSTAIPTSTVAPTFTPTPTQELGTGDVQITLRWLGLNDLDLYVTDPNGEEIYYNHSTSASNGELDVDSNLGCRSNITETPVENIFWPEGSAPSGHYQVHVDYYEQCTQLLETSFEVRILVDGTVSEFSGQVSEVKDHVLVTEFER